MDFSVTMPALPGASEASTSPTNLEAGNVGDASGAPDDAAMEGMEEGAADGVNGGEMEDNPVQRMTFVE